MAARTRSRGWVRSESAAPARARSTVLRHVRSTAPRRRRDRGGPFRSRRECSRGLACSQCFASRGRSPYPGPETAAPVRRRRSRASRTFRRDVGLSRPPDAAACVTIRVHMSASVLVVDDDPVFRRLARRMLTAGGLVVIAEADTVAAAMDVAREVRPDAALVDVGLPDGDGVTLASYIAALPWRPLVLLPSAAPDAASGDDIRRSGANGFVAKHELPNAPLRQLLVRQS